MSNNLNKFIESFRSIGAPSNKRQIQGLAIEGAGSFLEALKTFYTFNNKKLIQHESIDLKQPVNDLGHCFTKNGSDKSVDHRYDLVYKPIFDSYTGQHVNILEIGLGTRNTNIASHMWTPDTRVGASLKAYEQYFDNVSVFGADIDRDALFQTDKIKTTYINQLQPETFDQMHQDLGSPELDIFIEDGIHSVPGSLNSLNYALDAVKTGGWICIEDLYNPFGIWNVIATHIADNFDFKSVNLYESKGGMLIIQK